MRKFSKILTVLLTLALLCGVVMSVFASAAAGESREALSVSGAAHNRYSDFEASYSANKITPGFVWSNPGNMVVEYAEDGDGNTYARYSVVTSYPTAVGTTTKELWMQVAPYDTDNHRNGKSNIGAHDYVVIDFELGTDSYAFSYTVEGVTIQTTVVKGGETTSDVTKENQTVTLYKTVSSRAEYEAFVSNPDLLKEYTKDSTYKTSSTSNDVTTTTTKVTTYIILV
jgi:hypothetical protein